MSTDGGSDAAACPSCGAAVGDEDRFCAVCGAALREGGGDDGGDPGREAGDRSADADADLESWQKRCPECGAVLVTQAVRCTDCGTPQPDAATDDGRAATGLGSHDGPGDRAGGPGRWDDSHGWSPGARPPRDGEPPSDGRRRRTTHAGGGEVQYERDPTRSRGEDGSTGPGRVPGDTDARPHQDAGRDPEKRLRARQRSRRATGSGSDPFEPAPPSDRWWVGVLLPALLTLVGSALAVWTDPMAVATGSIPWVGDAYGLLELAIVLTPTLSPFALYFDRRYVGHETGTRPSAAYLLVAVPYLNVVVAGLYLWSRQRRLAAP
ncbi:zinc-ribbon domain-containing protein [Haloarchaeobius sp. HRN-SO-5]|uniref:zinc-ribbon domain-containing protein n=1 Tax=Haloarchaeobius sp. HRN-SO-5 TaxID=3446118 RepID=UPI003EBB3150